LRSAAPWNRIRETAGFPYQFHESASSRHDFGKGLMVKFEEAGPESKEVTLVSSLLEALGSGIIAEAAVALRSRAKLDKFDLPAEQLTPYFCEMPQGSRLAPRRLILGKRSKGRPKSTRDLSEIQNLGLGKATAFFEFIAVGNVEAAFDELSNLVVLKGKQLELLAYLFDDDDSLPKPFAWRFKLRARRAGKPHSRPSFSSRDFALARVLREAVHKFPHRREKEAAIHYVTTQTGMGRSAVAAAMDRLGVRSPDWKIEN